MSLNTFLTLFWYFIHFFAPKSHSEVTRSQKMAYFSHLGHYKGKWVKNVIFHDFFKPLLGVLLWCFRYVEMFLGSPEGVLSSRIHFWFVSERQKPRIFHPFFFSYVHSKGEAYISINLLPPKKLTNISSTMPLYCPIIFCKSNLISLNTILTLCRHFIHFLDPSLHFQVMRSFKMAYFGHLGGITMKND